MSCNDGGMVNYTKKIKKYLYYVRFLIPPLLVVVGGGDVLLTLALFTTYGSYMTHNGPGSLPMAQDDIPGVRGAPGGPGGTRGDQGRQGGQGYPWRQN